MKPLNDRFKLLISYHFYKKFTPAALKEKMGGPMPMLFSDSGGFSAFTKGVDISLEDYGNWIKAWGDAFETYANLDAIGDHEQTLKNQAALEKMGLSPIPVFHTGEPWDVLDHYVNNYEYVALGGMVPYMKHFNVIMPWLVQCFKRGKSHTRYHGFGSTSWRVVKAFRWYSVDSSSWTSSFRWGSVPVWVEKKGRFKNCKVGNARQCKKYAEEIRELLPDVGWADFADRKKFTRSNAIRFSLMSWLAAERWLQRRNDTGFRIYLVDSAVDNLRIAKEEFDKCIA